MDPRWFSILLLAVLPVAAGDADRQNVIRKHAALSMRPFGGKGASLVVPNLEKAAINAKDPEVRGGIVYTLASIGNLETTLPIFEKLLAKTNVDYVKRFLRAAIRVLGKEGGDFGRSGRFLFREDRDDPAREG